MTQAAAAQPVNAVGGADNDGDRWSPAPGHEAHAVQGSERGISP